MRGHRQVTQQLEMPVGLPDGEKTILGPQIRAGQGVHCTSKGEGSCYCPIQQLKKLRPGEVSYSLIQVSGVEPGLCPAYGCREPQLTAALSAFSNTTVVRVRQGEQTRVHWI